MNKRIDFGLQVITGANPRNQKEKISATSAASDKIMDCKWSLLVCLDLLPTAGGAVANKAKETCFQMRPKTLSLDLFCDVKILCNIETHFRNNSNFLDVFHHLDIVSILLSRKNVQICLLNVLTQVNRKI